MFQVVADPLHQPKDAWEPPSTYKDVLDSAHYQSWLRLIDICTRDRIFGIRREDDDDPANYRYQFRSSDEKAEYKKVEASMAPPKPTGRPS